MQLKCNNFFLSISPRAGHDQRVNDSGSFYIRA